VGVVVSREEFKRRALEELRKTDQNLYEKLKRGLETGDAWARATLDTAYKINPLLGFEEAVEKLKKRVEVA